MKTQREEERISNLESRISSDTETQPRDTRNEIRDPRPADEERISYLASRISSDSESGTQPRDTRNEIRDTTSADEEGISNLVSRISSESASQCRDTRNEIRDPRPADEERISYLASRISTDSESGTKPRDTRNEIRDTHIVLRLQVRNHPGVMSHICGLFARRAFNVEGILCMPTAGGRRSIALLLVKDDDRLEQLERQLAKLEDVLVIERADAGHAAFNAVAEFL